MRSVYKTDALIAVYKTDGKTKTRIASFKREHMAPGEMEQINISVSQFEDTQNDFKILVAIEKPEEAE